MLEFARIAVGEGRPLACGSCSADSERSYHSAELVGEAISAAAKAAGPMNLLLTGPEPFEHPELPRLVSLCVEAGAQRVGIETDGAALSLPSNAIGVLSAGVRHLRVRLLDADEREARTRDALAGMAGYLQAATSAGVSVAVTAVVPVCRHNLHSLTDTVLRVASLGAHAVRLVPGGELPDSASVLLAAACDTGMVNRMWVETDGTLPLPESHRLHVVNGGDRP